MMGRGILIALVAIAVAVNDPYLAAAGALVYAAGYTPSSPPRSRSTSPGSRADDRLPPRGRVGRVRPLARVRAPPLDRHPARPARPLREQGGRVPLARRARHDPLRDLVHALRALAQADPAADDGRGALRGAPGADLRGEPAEEGGRPLVPVRRGALPLHLGPEPRRVHPAAALGREVHALRDGAADLGHLRGDREPERHARARGHHVLRDPRGGHPLQRRRAATSRAGSRPARRSRSSRSSSRSR